ncbi:hypothetical protein L6164_015022 [Bauhinia variegata]|uniref:Uncharacterized protein n=1 Tax=Bauhinia variegata TaxID=167791 RepID=A0ACB9NKJ1_BAUVA|nr:hypothetical protein L6164_015022 [Bauhinia variegata]
MASSNKYSSSLPLFFLLLVSLVTILLVSWRSHSPSSLVSLRSSSPTSSLNIESDSTLHEAAESPSPSPSTLPETGETSEPPQIKQELVGLLGSEKVDTELKHEGTGDEVIITAHKYSKLKNIEEKLAKARYFIREASKVRNLTSTHQDPDYVPQGPIYRNANAFHRSYLEMEKMFKIFVYEEGEAPLVHDGPCKSIYATEGRFIHEMEKGEYYRTRDPDEAFVYFLPFSVVMIVEYIYKTGLPDIKSIVPPVADYVQIIANKYPYWNRSLGFDHFMLSCHDWGPYASSRVPQLFHNSIRVLCNANTSEGFKPAKDVSFPEINLLTGELADLIGGYSPSRRPILAFFAGRLHGHIRYLLLEQWKNKDQDVQVYEKLPQGVSYHSKLKSSRFCLCPSGYEVASPRVVEAIFAECVPVLISESYLPPFSDVLNWKSFSVQIQVKDIPNIKKILESISQKQYLRMQRRVKQVQRHFVPNDPPKRFDVFHMTIHSIWLRRLNIQIHGQ